MMEREDYQQVFEEREEETNLEVGAEIHGGDADGLLEAFRGSKVGGLLVQDDGVAKSR